MTPSKAMEVAEQAYSSGNLVTNDGYYEFDLDAAAAVIREAVLAETRELREGLFDAIKHGDAEHQAWLNDAIERYFARALLADQQEAGDA